MPEANIVSISSDTRATLNGLLVGRVCIVGVGNRQHGDDGAGPAVIDARDDRAAGVWIDAGVTPENFLEPIARSDPDIVLFVDAVAFGGAPGECRLFDIEAIDTLSVSTHTGSLATLGAYLSARTGAQIRLLGIGPQHTNPTEGLSPPISHTVQQVAAALSKALSK